MEIRENIIKRKLSSGEIATVVSGFNSPDIIDFLGQFGFDAAFIDFEHKWSKFFNLLLLNFLKTFFTLFISVERFL